MPINPGRIKIGWRRTVTSLTLAASNISEASNEAVPACGGATSPPVHRLVTLINNFHDLAVTVAIPAAALGYAIAGCLWLIGTPEAQRRARRMFWNVTVGLVVVLLSSGFVSLITSPICPGGSA